MYLRLKSILSIAQLIFLGSYLTTVDAQKNNKPEIVYEIFVQSFRDSNGDGIGDLQGVISKLDYIQSLGATAVWLMPVHPSPSYHKYDVTDYRSVHPDYGTMADLEALISELHKRDMKFILDFVVNHTSSQHPWFIQSVSSATSPYHEYYVWRDYREVQDEINKKTTTTDSDNITQWHKGRITSEERYYGFFWKGMPDLNFDHPKVREEIYNIGKFWLDKGVDGFRLDAARHIYPDDRMDDTRKFWEEFTMNMKSHKPDVMIIGEVWSDPHTLSTLFKGLPSLFNFELTKLIPDMINSGSASSFQKAYEEMSQVYKASGNEFEDAILLSNHDMDRIRSVLHDDISKSKLAASVLMTLPGTAYIYYGEEIGMLGKKPDEHIREPFVWGDDNFESKSWIKPTFSSGEKVASAEMQEQDPNSLLQHYRRWINIRKKYPVLARGEITFIPQEQSHLLVYTSGKNNQRLLVVHNLSDQEVIYQPNDQCKLILPEAGKDDGSVLIAPYSTVLFKS